jgi:hypothetical protein
VNGDHAFVDESIRNGAYLMCVTVVRPRHLDEARKALRLMRVRGQHKIHFAEESDKRRRQLLGDIALLPAKSAIYVARTGDQVGARRLILGAMTSDLIESGVHRMMLDSREGQNDRDRQVIHQATTEQPSRPLEYLHLPSAQEPLLWIPDAVAWAWGRGGSWRSRCQEMGERLEVRRITAP